MDSLYQDEKLIGTNEIAIHPRRRIRWKVLFDEIVYYPLRIAASFPLVKTLTGNEAASLSITQQTIAIRDLPAAFDGLTMAFLTDFHAGPLTPPGFWERVIEGTNRLNPDVVLLGGDYVTRDTVPIDSLVSALALLRAPLGIYGVLGNHDYYHDADAVRAALQRAGVTDVTNTGRWLTRADSRIRIAGVGDLWEDSQDLRAALDGTRGNEVAILLAHNPDYAVRVNDPRVRLMLSGHTHGGQICLPRVGAVVTNSKYGNRFASGLIPFESFQLYVSRGLGTVVVPVRYQCPPEIVLINLTPRRAL